MWISSGSTKKTRQNPRGDVAFEPTRVGNLLSSRFALLVLISIVREVYWGGEQPGTSVLVYMRVIEWIMHCNRAMIGFLPSSIVRLHLDRQRVEAYVHQLAQVHDSSDQLG